MPSKTSPKISDEERAKRIRETAKEIGADATKDEFRRAFEKIVPAKPPPSDKASR
jgi:hypothetical protein